MEDKNTTFPPGYCRFKDPFSIGTIKETHTDLDHLNLLPDSINWEENKEPVAKVTLFEEAKKYEDPIPKPSYELPVKVPTKKVVYSEGLTEEDLKKIWRKKPDKQIKVRMSFFQQRTIFFWPKHFSWKFWKAWHSKKKEIPVIYDANEEEVVLRKELTKKINWRKLIEIKIKKSNSFHSYQNFQIK